MNVLAPLTPDRIQYFPASIDVDDLLIVHCQDDFQPNGPSPRRILVSHHGTDFNHRALGPGLHFISVAISLSRHGLSPEEVRFGLTDVCHREAAAIAKSLRRSVTEYRSFLIQATDNTRHWFSFQQSVRLQKQVLTLSVSSAAEGRLACTLFGSPLLLPLGDLSADEQLRVAAALCAGWVYSV